jgi:hypothetical protein
VTTPESRPAAGAPIRAPLDLSEHFLTCPNPRCLATLSRHHVAAARPPCCAACGQPIDLTALPESQTP